MNDHSLECHNLFGVKRGGEIKSLVERATGGPCPCMQGTPCPFIPLQRVAAEPIVTATA